MPPAAIRVLVSILQAIREATSGLFTSSFARAAQLHYLDDGRRDASDACACAAQRLAMRADASGLAASARLRRLESAAGFGSFAAHCVDGLAGSRR